MQTDAKISMACLLPAFAAMGFGTTSAFPQTYSFAGLGDGNVLYAVNDAGQLAGERVPAVPFFTMEAQ